jgi:NAD(P)H dehydrogenase (quinone)
MSAGRDQLEKRQPPHSWSRPHNTLVSGEPFVQVLVIYCHPVAESFAAAAHAVVLQTLAAGGHDVTGVDLYAENFDPVMSRQERLDYQNTERNIRTVRKYDEQLATAEAIVLVYPAWW